MDKESTNDRYGALITIGGITLACFLLNLGMPPFFGLEGLLMLMFFFMGLASITGFMDGGFRNVSSMNRKVWLGAMTISVIFFFHIKYTEVECRVLDVEYTIEETNEFYLFRAEGYKLLYFEKDDVIFSDKYPLEVHEFYKTDIFGYELMSEIKFKSEIMENYVEPKILENYE
jgi:hypothetical protein